MTPGPTIVKKCSACLKSIKQHTIASGNTFGATFWTDGKREAPMLPDQPWLVMCPHCHELLWIDELEELGEIEPWGDDRGKFKDAREYEEPSLDDYFALIGNGAGDPQKERYARLRTWWAGNDQRRTNASEISMSPLEVENVTAFAQMLDESDSNDLVMKAEAMRELGRFDDALSLLAKSVDENISQAVKIIKGLSEKRDPYVREMHFK
jgi:hypothetical protein